MPGHDHGGRELLKPSAAGSRKRQKRHLLPAGRSVEGFLTASSRDCLTLPVAVIQMAPRWSERWDCRMRVPATATWWRNTTRMALSLNR